MQLANFSYDKAYQLLQQYASITLTADMCNIVRSIYGENEKSLNDVCYYATGYQDFIQFANSEGISQSEYLCGIDTFNN